MTNEKGLKTGYFSPKTYNFAYNSLNINTCFFEFLTPFCKLDFIL